MSLYPIKNYFISLRIILDSPHWIPCAGLSQTQRAPWRPCRRCSWMPARPGWPWAATSGPDAVPSPPSRPASGIATPCASPRTRGAFPDGHQPGTPIAELRCCQWRTVCPGKWGTARCWLRPPRTGAHPGLLVRKQAQSIRCQCSAGMPRTSLRNAPVDNAHCSGCSMLFWCAAAAKYSWFPKFVYENFVIYVDYLWVCWYLYNLNNIKALHISH